MSYYSFYRPTEGRRLSRPSIPTVLLHIYCTPTYNFMHACAINYSLLDETEQYK